MINELKRTILLTTAIHAKNNGVELTGLLKEAVDKSTPDQIANTEIALVNAEYELQEIKEHKNE